MDPTRSERGATAVMMAFTVFLLIGASAIAVDIAAIWLDRSADQKVTDSAAAAGVLEAVINDGQSACETALAYVAVNSDEIASIDDSGCATAFSASCTSGQALTVTSGRYQITVTYPVEDSDPLMTSGIVGASPQALHQDDGDECERVAVEMRSTRDSFFAQVLGFNQGTTTVHTVATTHTGTGQPPINLLVLDRHGCEAVKVRGNGGIIVDAVIAEDNMGNPTDLVEGIIAADSDGSVGCVTGGVIAVEGTGSRLRADGPEGCAGQTGTHSVGSYTAGEGCGKIQTFAPGTPGCAPVLNLPACSPGSGGANPPNPVATPLPQPYTRERADHRWNCFADYTWLSANPGTVSWATDPLTTANEQNINPCTQGTPDYIYQLINAVGQTGLPTGLGSWSTWTGLGHACNLNPGTAITVTGNVVIDCPNFTVRRSVTITGNAVFNGNVSVTSGSGHFFVGNSLGAPGWAFFRGGTLVKDAQAQLTLNYTMVYMSKTSRVQLSGGTGSLTWVSPDSGDFDDLALWSDSPLDHFWAGQASLRMEGVFFMPIAKAFYSGTSSQNQTEAQWIADKLEASGGAALVVTPSVGRSLSFGGPQTTLIR